MSLADIVNIQISPTPNTPSRAGFGTILIAAYHTLHLELVRSYTGLAGMIEDGYSSTDPAYRIASAIFSQRPRPKRVKVGRRALPFSQVIDLTPATPAENKVYSATINGNECAYTALGADNLAAVCTALASAINTAISDGDVDAIIATAGSTAGVQNLTGASLNGIIGGGVMDPPREIVGVFTAHGDWDETTMTISGKNKAGDTIVDTIAIPNGGDATVNSAGRKLYYQITNVNVPTQTGTGGAFTLGVRTQASASGASGTKVVVTTTTPGVLTTYEDVSATLSLRDQTANPGIQTDLANIRAADSDWYGVVLDSNSEAEIRAAAAYTETITVLFGAQTADTEVMDSGEDEDVASELAASSYGRTAILFHPDVGVNFLAAGTMANRFVDPPGSDTWVYKTIRGVSVYELTDSQKSALHAKNAFTYTNVSGVFVTEGGKVAAGEWVDVVRFIDWLTARMQERVYYLLLSNRKIPYTDAGISLVTTEVEAVLTSGIAAGGLASDPAPTVTAPVASEVDPIDKANRLLPDVNFSATLAGAIHATEITGGIGV